MRIARRQVSLQQQIDTAFAGIEVARATGNVSGEVIRSHARYEALRRMDLLERKGQANAA